MSVIRAFVEMPLVAALIDRYWAALTTEGADRGPLRAAVERELLDRQRDERDELRDYLDSLDDAEASAGAPSGHRPTCLPRRVRTGGR